MLQSIQLTNFKSWRELPSTKLGRITGLFGPNSSGKSSIIQSLLLLKQTAESPDRRQVLNLGDDRSYVELGTFGDVIFQHATRGELEIELTWENTRRLQMDPGARHPASSVSFVTRIDALPTGELRVRDFDYHVGPASFRLYRVRHNEYGAAMSPHFEMRPGFTPEMIGQPIKCYGFSEEFRQSFVHGDILGDLQSEFEALFAGVYYLGPLRERARRQYTWTGSTPTDMGARGERVVDALVASRQREILVRSRPNGTLITLEERVAAWLKDLGLIESFRVEELAPMTSLFRVLVRHKTHGPETALADVGFGVSQVLPVLVLLYYVPNGSTVLLEHPEIHLHPSVQAGLADVLVDVARTREVQVIVESHSEHLLRRLQRRVAESWMGIGDEDVRLYFVDERDGESKISPLELDTYGKIANWPEGFFGDPLEDLVATEEAGVQKRLEHKGR